jgi:hypothetical protein
MSNRSSSQSVHWQAPTAILLAFTASLAFGIGHHLFYSSLDQVPVDINTFNQQTNIAIGTGFAFLFRACLAIACCTAYWQLFWHTALRKTLTISSIDALTAVLGSVLDFANVRTFFFNPGLTALALLAWLVPFASLLPPATLSVLPSTTTNSSYMHIPVPFFASVVMAETNFRMIAGDQFIKDSIMDIYLKPSVQLSRLVTTTAYRGAVPDHQTLFPNSTYELSFNAPAVQCTPISQKILDPFNAAAGCDFMAMEDNSSDSCNSTVPYVSWVPDGATTVPFANGTLDNQLLPLDLELGQLNTDLGFNTRYLGQSEDGPATLFIATRSQVPPLSQRRWDVLNCSMYNATYVVQASSDSNRRSQALLSEVRIIDSAPFKPESSAREVDEPSPVQDLAMFSYMGMMESLNRVLVGTMVSKEVLDADSPYYWDQRRLRVQSPSLMSTLLAFTHELVPFTSRSRSNSSALPPDADQWTDVAQHLFSIKSLSKEALTSPSYNRSLASAVEELFQNMTLSLFSDPRFLRDSEELVNVTRYYTRNTYFYSQKNLLLSYGIALFLTLLASIAGCVAIFFNGASYTYKFSTVLRTTAGLRELVAKKDRTGADPLPKYLSRTRVDLGRGDEGSLELRERSGSRSERSAMMGEGGSSQKEPGIVSQRSLSIEM